jgi:hypothetical protein
MYKGSSVLDAEVAYTACSSRDAHPLTCLTISGAQGLVDCGAGTKNRSSNRIADSLVA